MERINKMSKEKINRSYRIYKLDENHLSKLDVDFEIHSRVCLVELSGEYFDSLEEAENRLLSLDGWKEYTILPIYEKITDWDEI